MYTRAGKAVLALTVLAFIVADGLALFDVCSATPPYSYGGMAVGLIWEFGAVGAVALSMQYFRQTFCPQRVVSTPLLLRTVVIAAVFCFLSASLFRQSVLFSDTLFVRGKTSVGSSCFR